MSKLHIPEKKISVVYNGIHPERYKYDAEYVDEFRKEHQIGDKKVIGLLARMSPIKGHLNLVNAISFIPREKMNQHVIVMFGASMVQEPLCRMSVDCVVSCAGDWGGGVKITT